VKQSPLPFMISCPTLTMVVGGQVGPDQSLLRRQNFFCGTIWPDIRYRHRRCEDESADRTGCGIVMTPAMFAGSFPKANFVRELPGAVAPRAPGLFGLRLEMGLSVGAQPPPLPGWGIQVKKKTKPTRRKNRRRGGGGGGGGAVTSNPRPRNQWWA